LTSDEIPQLIPHELVLRAPDLSGFQLIPAVQTRPGDAPGTCFAFERLGVPGLQSLLTTKLHFATAASGAAGGTITVIERGGLGSCTVSVPTHPAETAAELAAAVAEALETPQPGCSISDAATDARANGDDVIFSLADSIVVCVDDAGAGFSFVPAETGNRPPDCSGAVADPATLWPAGGKLVDVTVAGIVDPDGNPFTVQVLDVRQDELQVGPSDAVIRSGEVVGLRAERDGSGDGRVYHVRFAATDFLGGRCEDEVLVCVPHDQRFGAGCGDGGPLYSSIP
jgi:hypothetical protein